MIWQFCGRPTVASRGLLVGLFTAAALACLYWSGQRELAAGVVVGIKAVLHLWSSRAKVALVSVLLVFGLAGFL
jgi:hypothetical protein